MKHMPHYNKGAIKSLTKAWTHKNEKYLNTQFFWSIYVLYFAIHAWELKHKAISKKLIIKNQPINHLDLYPSRILSWISWYNFTCCSFILSIGFATWDCDLKLSISSFMFYLSFLNSFSLYSSCSYMLFIDSRFYFSSMLVLFNPFLVEVLF